MVLTAALLLGWAWLRYPGSNQPQFGTSFSVKYANELGLNWREAYVALLDDLGVGHLRLMSYWDELEPQPGQLRFGDLDWQLEEAGKRGVNVSLAIGLRQPRYPECHYPAWASQMEPDELQPYLDKYLTAVIERYRDNPAIVSWQLENEALNRGFGVCRSFSRRRLQHEYELVRRLDNRPVIINLSDEGGVPLRSPRGDQVGLSVYGKFYYHGWWGRRYLEYPMPPAWHRLRAAIIHTYLGRESLIHELQAEPWGPRPTHQLSRTEQDETMSLEQLRHMITYARQTKIPHIDLWGAEWWYWRKQQGDPAFWELTKVVFRS
jgi:hypothetical protein